MTDKNSSRKTIFKNELKYIFEKYDVSGLDIDNVVYSLFENPVDLSKQYIVKDELSDLEKLKEKLDAILSDNDLIGAINSLFLVQDDLELPIDIKRLILGNEKIGVLVGAGVSKLIGFPLWYELGDNAIKYLYEKNRINYFEYQTIQREIIDPKQKITIFDGLIPRKTGEAKEFYEKYFNKSEANNSQNPYDLLVKIDWIKLTSNIDKEFYKALNSYYNLLNQSQEDLKVDQIKERKKAKIASNNFDSANMDYETIYHIHGFMDQLDQTILTTKDYLEAYYNETGRLKEFLQNIFNEYTIIFIGYGLEEFSILEHIIRGSKEHHVLLGAYLNEMNLFKLKKDYFKTINISPVSYYLDFTGYNRLYHVLNAWIQQINEERNKEYYENVSKIDEVID